MNKIQKESHTLTTFASLKILWKASWPKEGSRSRTFVEHRACKCVHQTAQKQPRQQSFCYSTIAKAATFQNYLELSDRGKRNLAWSNSMENQEKGVMHFSKSNCHVTHKKKKKLGLPVATMKNSTFVLRDLSTAEAWFLNDENVCGLFLASKAKKGRIKSYFSDIILCLKDLQ